MAFGFGSKKRRIEETRRNRREEKRRKKLDKKNAPLSIEPVGGSAEILGAADGAVSEIQTGT